jgi:uncharacterized membrane protein
MTGSIAALALAVALFVATHLVLSHPPLRRRIVGVLGEQGFRAAYSVLALALLTWVSFAYRDAPIVDLWIPPIGLTHLSLLIMPLACILVVAGLTTPNPASLYGERAEVAARGPVGILKVTRHPMMWGVALWGVAHLLASGDWASVVLFGGLTVLALGGARAQDGKKRLQLGDAWQDYLARTSFLPFGAVVAGRTRVGLSEIGWWRIGAGIALYALLLAVHPWLFGVSSLPL